jgi:photosystem II stability/assembly factor-like uncharacterized protein
MGITKSSKITMVILVMLGLSNAQQGCPGNLPSNIFPGPDSLHTDADQTFRSLTINPLNPNNVLIGTEGNGIFITHDGGSNWSWIREGFQHIDVTYAETWSAVYNPIDTSKIYLATSDSPGPIEGTNPSCMAGVYVSTNGGRTWAQRNCGLTNSKAGTIWCNPLHPDSMLVTITGEAPSFTNPPLPYYTGGIFHSTDGGLNWAPSIMPANADSNEYWRLEQRGNVIITCGINRNGKKSLGFIKSVDHGYTWQLLNEPLANRSILNYAVSKDASKILATVQDSNFVYSSTNGGDSWDKIPLPVGGTFVFHPVVDDTVFFSTGTSLFKSKNGITTGDLYSSDYKFIKQFPHYIEKIAFSESDPKIMYISTKGYRVYKSTDGGESFVEIVKLRDIMNDLTKSDVNIQLHERNIYLKINNGILQLSSADNISNGELKLFDFSGRLVKEISNINSSTTRLDKEYFSKGFYIFNIVQENKVMSFGKVLIR